jgi:hypothetical protein
MGHIIGPEAVPSILHAIENHVFLSPGMLTSTSGGTVGGGGGGGGGKAAVTVEPPPVLIKHLSEC